MVVRGAERAGDEVCGDVERVEKDERGGNDECHGSKEDREPLDGRGQDDGVDRGPRDVR